MSDEETKGKIKEVIDNPGDSLEKGVKKGWETIKDFGKEVIKKIKKEEKK